MICCSRAMPFGEHPLQSPSLDTFAEGSLFLPSSQAIYPPSAHTPASAARSKSHMIWRARSYYFTAHRQVGLVGPLAHTMKSGARNIKSTMRPIRNRAMGRRYRSWSSQPRFPPTDVQHVEYLLLSSACDEHTFRMVSMSASPPWTAETRTDRPPSSSLSLDPSLHFYTTLAG
jgi:hypothetical protein